MLNVVRMACIYGFLGITPAHAAEYIQNVVPEAKLVGQGRAQILVWDVYDAKLYAPGGVYIEDRPFALELSYLQVLEGTTIADHAVSEMRRLGYRNEVKLAAWHDRISRIFPDVVPGNTVTGVYIPGGRTIFYKDGEEAGYVDDPSFGKEFFRIWLDARTSLPSLRKDLLNLNNDRKGRDDEMPKDTRNDGVGHVS